MSYDACIGVTALGLVTGGDLITGKFSIGGADPRVPGTFAPALGISRHGFFEVDNSMTRQGNTRMPILLGLKPLIFDGRCIFRKSS